MSTEPPGRTGSPVSPTAETPAGRAADGESAPAGRDAWHELGRFTAARIALGRAGGSCRTATLLELRAAHARARDAVHRPLALEPLEAALHEVGLESLRLASAARDFREFLLRPDLGRELDENSSRLLLQRRAAWGARSLAVIVSGGLAAQAAERHAAPTLAALLPPLREAGWTLYPVFVVPLARVKLQDELGERLGARHALILLGERPGLGAPDSLGAYFTFEPRAERSDADRNCISNIRPEGLPPAQAGVRLAQLLLESARLGLSGVALKDTTALPASPAGRLRAP